MKSPRRWWLIFGTGALAVAAALVWVSLVVLRLEAEAQHQAAVRLALWRMDSWLGPRLAREANRPYFEYLPFYAQQRAYTKILNPIEANEVYTPSPLLTFESEFFPLHFQVDAAGIVSSPQAPEGNWLDLAEASYLAPGAIDRKRPLLDRVRGLMAPAQIEGCVAQAETMLAELSDNDSLIAQASPQPQVLQQWAAGQQQEMQVQSAVSKADVQRRYNTNYPVQTLQSDAQIAQRFDAPQFDADQKVEVGPLVAIWMSDQSQSEARPASTGNRVDPPLDLLFVRRVRIGEQALFQGVLGDWPALQKALLEQINDLFPRARLRPLTEPAAANTEIESGRLLASIPVLLEAPCPALAAGPLITPARTTMLITWLAVALAVVAASVTLRASIAYARKRSRFASAVTHELRTPLTTFRMYSEMLAEGMVRDQSQRQEYLRTLKSESSRLATLVENVLSYARLEDGRTASHAQRMTVRELLDRLKGVLTRRATEASMELRVENQAPSEAAVTTDPEAVGQILFNLVDNACKYANGTTDRSIDLVASMRDGCLRLMVRDHGPGVAPEHARRIFAPFDRGAHGPGDTIPGVGLGLALARGLARDLGGELTLEPCPRGACFQLVVPAQGDHEV
jgi:signal transduction histidine kinase